MDIPTPRNAGKIVKVTEYPQFCQPLKDSQIKRCAADSSARKANPLQLAQPRPFIGIISGIAALFRAENTPAFANLWKFLAQQPSTWAVIEEIGELLLKMGLVLGI